MDIFSLEVGNFFTCFYFAFKESEIHYKIRFSGTSLYFIKLFIFVRDINQNNFSKQFIKTEAEFKKIEQRLKLKPPLKYGWFHLKLY